MNFYQGKKVLVTGGAGFIGSHIAEELIERGAEVYVLVRNKESKTSNLKTIRNRIRFVYSDMNSLQECIDIVRGINIVLHFAAKFGGINYNAEHPGSLITENTIPFLNMIEASRINNVERFLTVSSACVYPKECPIPIKEEEWLNGEPEEENKGYGWAKRIQEITSRNYVQQYGMKIAIVRLYNVYGPRSSFNPKYANVIPAIIRRMNENENPFMVWGGGEQTRSFMYVKDACRGILEITEKKADAEGINLGSDLEIKIIDLIKTIARLMNKNLEYKIDEKKPTGHMRRIADVTKAKTIIDYENMIPIETGLSETISWYRKEISTEGL